MALSSQPELLNNCVLGGPTPPDMLAENERRNQEYQRRRLAIIAKYDVFEEYLTPLHTEEQRLTNELKKIRLDISELERLRATAGDY